MKPLVIGMLIALALALAGRAQAEVKQMAADGFLIEHRYAITVAPDAVWRDLVHPELWWPSDHTWCFCERWDDNAVEHGRVVMARPGTLLRMNGALGRCRSWRRPAC